MFHIFRGKLRKIESHIVFLSTFFLFTMLLFVKNVEKGITDAAVWTLAIGVIVAVVRLVAEDPEKDN
jgi:hypothetical protein